MSCVTTDPKWEGTQTLNMFESFMLRFMCDERDMIFVRTVAVMNLTVVPAAMGLFMLSSGWVWTLAVPYVAATFALFGGRYGLMLHANGHRPIYKREYRWMNHYVPFVLGPLLGHTPTSFRAHHMMMHHAENNMLADQSSTLPYERDNFVHFLHYWSRFFLLGYAHLVRYLRLRGRDRAARSFIQGELSWLLLVSVSAWINPSAAMVVFVIPWLMMRWLLMCGNWAQHAFVDIDDPDNAYTNSHNLTNTWFNHIAYNDGYHIVHHLFPSMHWTEMALYYEQHQQDFVDNDSVVFDGLMDNLMLWFLLMTHNYDKLARHLVDFHGRTHEEKVAFLKSRTRGTLGERLPHLYFETPADVTATARKAA
jgi:fatty acid desaturase